MRITIFLTLLAASLLTAQTPPKADAPIGLTPETMVWTEGPSTLPPGAKMAVLEGSPKADGMFTMRLRIPAGSAIPPHWHPRQERVTVLSGAIDLGFGSVANTGKTRRYGAGSFYVNPPRVMHSGSVTRPVASRDQAARPHARFRSRAEDGDFEPRGRHERLDRVPMTALHLLQAGQEARMSRVEPKERPAKREAQEGRRQSGQHIDRKPSQAEGDEWTVEEALRNQERRR